MKIGTTTHFDAAHFLPRYEGLCHNMHGHRWKVDFEVSGIPRKYSGMIIDFVLLKSVVKPLDHSLLNDKIDNPTAENIVEYILYKLKDVIIKNELDNIHDVTVRVWESPDSPVEDTMYVSESWFND